MSQLINWNLKPHWKENLSNEEYHADKSAVGSSTLRKVLKSPLSFHADFYGQKKEEPNEAMRFGNLVHAAVLEGPMFLEKMVVAPKFVGLTKDGRESTQSGEAKKKKAEWYSAMEAENRIIVTEEEQEKIVGIINSINSHEGALKLLANGAREVSGYFSDPETGIVNKIRPDFVSFDLGALVDLKTTQSVLKQDFQKTIWNYRYDFQLAMYSEGIKAITGRYPKYQALIAVETTAPYEVAVYIADEGMISKGQEDYRRALDTLSECLSTDSWPRYQREIEDISLPGWAF
jgi:hypothetical protein